MLKKGEKHPWQVQVSFLEELKEKYFTVSKYYEQKKKICNLCLDFWKQTQENIRRIEEKLNE